MAKIGAQAPLPATSIGSGLMTMEEDGEPALNWGRGIIMPFIIDMKVGATSDDVDDDDDADDDDDNNNEEDEDEGASSTETPDE